MAQTVVHHDLTDDLPVAVLPVESPLPMLQYSWDDEELVLLLTGSRKTTERIDPVKVNVRALAAKLRTYVPPYSCVRYRGQEAHAQVSASFLRLRMQPIEARSPLSDPICGDVFQVSNGSRDVQLPVITHLTQVLGQPGVAGTNGLSSFFTEDIRMRAVSNRGLKCSPHEAWKLYTQRIVKRAIQQAKGHMKGEPDRLRLSHFSRALFMFASPCTAFRPMVARHMYQGAKRVLDMCGGWGDRLLAMLATDSVTHAVVVDPQPDLHPRYQAMRARLRSSMVLHTVVAPFEDLPSPTADPSHPVNAMMPYDVVFTSPPFLHRESYSSSATQSNMRFPTLKRWVSGFLLPMARGAFARLRHGGVLGLAMADYREETGKVSFTATVVERMAELEPTAEFCGVILFSLLARDETLRHAPQPIFIWQRVDPGKPRPDLPVCCTRVGSAGVSTNISC